MWTAHPWTPTVGYCCSAATATRWPSSVHTIESQIAANVARKERQANQITTELVAEMRRVREAVSA